MFYALIGVLWLRAGDDRLDVVPLRRVDAGLRRVLRGGSRLHSLDDHRGALLSGTTAGRHVHRCAGQLAGQLPRRNRLPHDEGELTCRLQAVIGNVDQLKKFETFLCSYTLYLF